MERGAMTTAFSDAFPLDQIKQVTLYKRDEVTTDLICCEVELYETCWTFHEEQADWQALVEYLTQLPGFKADWFASVSQPPFQPCETLAFCRS